MNTLNIYVQYYEIECYKMDRVKMSEKEVYCSNAFSRYMMSYASQTKVFHQK